VLVALNFGHEAAAPLEGHQGKIVISTHLDRTGETVSGDCHLRAGEGVIVELT